MDLTTNMIIDDIFYSYVVDLGVEILYYIPTQMRDFHNTELGKFDWIEQYDDGFRLFICIVNTDYSYGNGKQWCGFFGDFTDENFNFFIEFFYQTSDSKDDAVSEIKSWIEKKIEYYSFKLKREIIFIETMTDKPCQAILAKLNSYDFEE